MYLDLLLFINIVMNFLLLWITARLAGLNPYFWRLVMGSLVGACYVLLIFSPLRDFFFNFVSVVILSWIIIFIAFNPFKIAEALLIWLFFFITSFIMGGAIFAFSSLLKPITERGIVDISPPCGLTIFFVGALVFILINFIWPHIEQLRWSRIMRAELLIEYAGRIKIVSALVDTGNQLIEPVSGRPVIIISYKELKNLLPQDIYEYFEKRKVFDWPELERVLINSAFEAKFHVIPFNSVGVEDGLILGFRPDRIRIFLRGKEVRNPLPAVIGISQGSLGIKKLYQALLPPRLVQSE